MTKTKSPTVELFQVDADLNVWSYQTGRQPHPGRDRHWRFLSESIRHQLRRLPFSVGLCGLASLISFHRREAGSSARRKLNTIYLGLAAFLAALVGLAFKSIAMFIICLIAIVAGLFHDGSVRPQRVKRRR